MLPLIVPLSFSFYAQRPLILFDSFPCFIGISQEDVLDNGLVRDGVALWARL